MPRNSYPGSPADVFGRRVRLRRLQLGMSQEALAEAAEMHRTYVGTVERGGCSLGLQKVVRLAEALDMDPGELVGGLETRSR